MAKAGAILKSVGSVSASANATKRGSRHHVLSLTGLSLTDHACQWFAAQFLGCSPGHQQTRSSTVVDLRRVRCSDRAVFLENSSNLRKTAFEVCFSRTNFPHCFHFFEIDFFVFLVLFDDHFALLARHSDGRDFGIVLSFFPCASRAFVRLLGVRVLIGARDVLLLRRFLRAQTLHKSYVRNRSNSQVFTMGILSYTSVNPSFAMPSSN